MRGKGLVVTRWSNLAVVVWPSHVVASLWCRVCCIVVRGSGRVLSCAAVVPWLLHGHVIALWLFMVVVMAGCWGRGGVTGIRHMYVANGNMAPVFHVDKGEGEEVTHLESCRQ